MCFTRSSTVQDSRLHVAQVPLFNIDGAVGILSTGQFALPSCIGLVKRIQSTHCVHCSNLYLWVQPPKEPNVDRWDDVDDLLRARLTGQDDADTLLAAMRRMNPSNKACNIEVSDGIVTLLLKDYFALSLTVRQSKGPW